MRLRENSQEENCITFNILDIKEKSWKCTLSSIEKGVSTVSIGAYVAVLCALEEYIDMIEKNQYEFKIHRLAQTGKVEWKKE